MLGFHFSFRDDSKAVVLRGYIFSFSAQSNLTLIFILALYIPNNTRTRPLILRPLGTRNITQKQEIWSLQYFTTHSHANTINTKRLKPIATLVF